MKGGGEFNVALVNKRCRWPGKQGLLLFGER
jgi:hypothetical protein